MSSAAEPTEPLPVIDDPVDTPVIELIGVSHHYDTPAGPVPVLHDISVRFETGRVTALVGRSGSGKSTLLTIMGLLMSPSTGEVRVMGEAAHALSSHARTRLRASRIGFVFQAFHLVEHKTVAENVELPAAYSPEGGPMRARVAATLETVGLAHRARAFPRTLSGGERQRCAIARALITDAPILLCDEPTGNLDDENSESIIVLLERLAHIHGRAVVIITHDQLTAARADRILTLADGRLADGNGT